MNSLIPAVAASLTACLTLTSLGSIASAATLPSQLGQTCKLAHVDAQMTRVVQPSVPEIARLMESYGTSTIRVDLDDNGNVRAATVYRTSGSTALDREAIYAAELSSFSPEQNQCTASAGSYLATYDFVR